MTRRDAHSHNLTLAVGIAEWATVLDHMDVLATMGMAPSDRTLAALEREHYHMCRLWRTAVHKPFFASDVPTIVAEARAYATHHQAEIDELLNREEVST